MFGPGVVEHDGGARHRGAARLSARVAHRQGGLGQGFAMPVNGNAAHIGIRILQAETKALLRCIQNLDGLGHNLRAYAISRQNRYFLHM